MTTSSTEEEARRLLATAAATIDVDETAPMALTGLPEPRPRRWPVLAAAAGVVLAIGGGYLVTDLGGGKQPETSPGVTDSAKSPGVVPGLIGSTRDEAAQQLADRNLRLVIVREYSCDLPQGYVLGTEPGPGAHVPAGSTVRVRVVAGILQNVRCFPPLQGVWDLVRLARGLAEAPSSLTGVELRPGVLRAVLQMVSRSPSEGGAYRLAVSRSLGPCSGGIAGSAWDLAVWVETPGADVSCPDPLLLIQLNTSGDLTEVAVADARTKTVTTEELAAGMNRLAAAGRFVAWARGEGPPPEFADRVRVMYFGGPAFGSTGWVDDPEDRRRYAGCSGLGFPDCGLDPVALLVHRQDPVIPTEGRSTCADGGEVPARFADAPEDAVRIEEGEPASCRNAWAVELWIDEDGVIYGINQAGG